MSHLQESIHTSKGEKARRGFYIHLTAYLLANALMIGINLATTPGKLWFYWPLAGWGFGLLAHGAAAFWLAGRR